MTVGWNYRINASGALEPRALPPLLLPIAAYTKNILASYKIIIISRTRAAIAASIKSLFFIPLLGAWFKTENETNIINKYYDASDGSRNLIQISHAPLLRQKGAPIHRPERKEGKSFLLSRSNGAEATCAKAIEFWHYFQMRIKLIQCSCLLFLEEQIIMPSARTKKGIEFNSSKSFDWRAKKKVAFETLFRLLHFEGQKRQQKKKTFFASAQHKS